MKTAAFGSISSGTMRAEDLIPEFAYTLAQLSRDGAYTDLLKEAEAIEDYESEDADYILSDLFDALNDYAPAYGYFGAHPGDGADYGFWLHEDWEQCAKDDGVLFVSDLSEVPEDLPFGGKVCVVNDHGNATLYVMDYAKASSLSQLREVWSVV